MTIKNKPIHSQALVIDEQIQFVDGGIASRTLVDKKPGTITLIDQKPIVVKAGQMAILPANVPHSVRAQTQSKMLLVMIRG